MAANDRTNYSYGSVSIANKDSTVESFSDTAGSSFNDKKPASILLRSILFLFLVTLIAAACFFLQPKQEVSENVKNVHVNVDPAVPSPPATTTRDESEIPFRYNDQLVDHFDTPGLTVTNATTWSQRYFISSKYFAGPGHPIFVIIGGEGVLHKILYPFVSEHLAKTFNAYVIQPEHRFYGVSQPFGHKVKHNHDLVGYLTTEQAMADIIRLVRHKQDELQCSSDKSSPNYCPIITVGGSYPGFLSAMLRFIYPDVVDISYASSAPLHLYAQEVHPSDYYEFVTKVAEEASTGCSAATKSGLHGIGQMIDDSNLSVKDLAKKMNVCPDSIPAYITTEALFREELMMIVSSSYADFNMGYYPPKDENTQLMMACKVFQNKDTDLWEKMVEILGVIGGDDGNGDADDALIEKEKSEACFEMLSFLPAGARATISSSDWSGAGDGNTGRSWEFQLCSDLIVRTGFSEKSMFPPREWTLDWLTTHCRSRFGVTPQPYRLVDMWGFNDLVGNGASRILFTNGLNDGWSVSSILEDLSDSLVAINFPNGAHHSDLSHEGPNDNDTDDIKAGYGQIANLLGKWLKDIKDEQL
jgi:Serine carboxypeptidase S28